MFHRSVAWLRRPRRATACHPARATFLAIAGLWIAAGWVSSPAWSQQTIVAPAVEASAESLAAWDYDLSADDEALLEDVQRGCFQYFWREVGTPAMLAKDKTSDTVCSIAAVGFQLSSLPIAVERGWISRAEGQQR